ncbi:MAG: hypothetical protein ACTTJ7_06005 [Treponema sp.]
MNKGLAKTATAVAVASFLAIGSIFADSHKSEWKERMRSDDMPCDAKSIPCKDFPQGERSMHSNMAPAVMGNSIMGDWGIRDAGKAVKVEFDRNGTMEIKWQQGLALETEWKGFWTSTDTEITFTVKMKETETWTDNTKQELRERMSATWKIQYVQTDDTLTLTGNDLPKELTNLTLYRIGR